jgi:hypothetical protein
VNDLGRLGFIIHHAEIHAAQAYDRYLQARATQRFIPAGPSDPAFYIPLLFSGVAVKS